MQLYKGGERPSAPIVWVILKMLYIKIGVRFALHVDADRRYGLIPPLSFKSCKSETILDIPYTRIIFTSAKRLREEREYAKGPEPVSENTTGTTKN